MNKFGYWALAIIFGWLTYKFLTAGVPLMGDDNGKAIFFSAAVSLAGPYGATSSNN